MRSLSRYILCIILLALGGSIVVSAQKKDKFDASVYSMQKRHIKKSPRFIENTRFIDNTFISIYSGIYQPFQDEASTYSLGPSASIAVGKWLSDVSGFRLGLYGNSFLRNLDNERGWSVGADASYLYNFIFNPQFCSLSLVGSLGYRNILTNQERNNYLSANIGFNVAMRLFKDIDFHFEPYVGLQRELGVDNGGKEATRFSYGMTFGLSYNVLPEKVESYRPSYRTGQFISVMGGGQFQIADLVYNTVGVLKSIGPQGALSYGKWYNSTFALRASLFYSNDIYAEYMDQYEFMTQYYGGRVEGMFELLHFASVKKIKLSVLAGAEVGGLHKTDLNELIKDVYFGLTGGLQFSFNVAGPVSLFLEPRFSMVPYSFKPSFTISTEAERVNYIDFVTSVNLGISVDLRLKE